MFILHCDSFGCKEDFACFLKQKMKQKASNIQSQRRWKKPLPFCKESLV